MDLHDLDAKPLARLPGAGRGADTVMGLKIHVDPYYSVSRRNPPVYHSRSDCPDGKWIHSEHRRLGTGGWPACGQCEALEAVVETREHDG
jgi:hypothetical protein